MSELFLPSIREHLPIPALPRPRYGGAGAFVDSFVYYVGGGTKGPFPEVPNLFRMKMTDQFKPASNSWEILADMPRPRAKVGCAVVGRKIYVFGGLLYEKPNSFSDDVHSFDTVKLSWTQLPKMTIPRVGPACVAVGDIIYVIGGNSYLPGGGAGPIKSCAAFNTTTNTWSTVADLPVEKGRHGCVAWNNKLYAVGGSGPSFVFDIATSKWSTIQSPPVRIPDPNQMSTSGVCGMDGWIFLFGACETLGAYDDQSYLYHIATNKWSVLKGGNLIRAKAIAGVAGKMKEDSSCTIYVMGGAISEVNNQPTDGVESFCIQMLPYIDSVRLKIKDYFNHLSGPSYIRILDTPHVWGMPFGEKIMPQALVRQADFERAIVEIVQKAKYRCDLSSLNSPDPDWVRAILGAIDTALTKKMGRKQPTQFRFLFGQTPTVPIGEPANYTDFKAALIRLFRERSQYWEVLPEIWMGRFYRLGAGIISVLQAQVFGGAVIGVEDTKMTWNHTKIISVDGCEALVGGHNLNMDLFRSYPPVHDVSTVIHGEAAYGPQLFLNKMWECGTDLLTKESLDTGKLSWVNRDKDKKKPEDPLAQPDATSYMKSCQDALMELHRKQTRPTDTTHPDAVKPELQGIREDDLQTLADLELEVFQERITYDTYDKLNEYKLATRMLTLGKYWDGPEKSGNFQKASELMKEHLIKTAKYRIRMSQMDIVSAWKKNWSDHMVCQWVLEALLANQNLVVQIVVSPLDAGAGAEGDQYSFGSGASRTFDLLKYYMTHDVATDKPLSDSDGLRANALKRLHVAPFYFTDQLPADKTIEGKTYKWPNLTKEGYTATLKQPPISEKPPKKGVIGSAAMSVINASGYIYDKVESAPGNHAKIMIIDDDVYVIGSDNLYPGYLSEVDYIVEGVDAVSELVNSYWKPLWKYSEPHSISGQMRFALVKIVYQNATKTVTWNLDLSWSLLQLKQKIKDEIRVNGPEYKASELVLWGNGGMEMKPDTKILSDFGLKSGDKINVDFPGDGSVTG